MALVLKDRVLETCTSPGTGTVTLLGAVTGYQSFSTVGNGNTCYYAIADQSGANWEVGIGTYSTAGTLARTTVLSSSNSGNLVNFSTGSQNVFLTYPSERSVNLSSAALTSGRVTYATTDGLLTDSANLTFSGSALAVTGNLTSTTAQFGTNPAGVSIGVIGIPNQKRIYGRNAANSADVSILYVDGSNGLTLGPTDSITVTSAGLVGIGTASPATALDVNGSIRLSATGYIGFGGGTNYIEGDNSNNLLKFATNNSERMRIDSSGNVGIGTTTPSNYSNYVTLALNDTTGSLIELKANGAANGELVSDNNSFQVKTISSIPLVFGTANTERMRIDSSGNVGIGTSSITAKLEVKFDTTVSASNGAIGIENAGSGEQGITFTKKGYSFNGPAAAITYNGSALGVSSASYLSFRTNAGTDSFPTERMRIDSSGNLLVGTTSAVGKLTIDAPNTLVSPTISMRNAGGLYGFDFDSENVSVGRLDLYAVTNGARSQVISFMRSSGNVGIATTNPTRLLEIGTGAVTKTAIGQSLISLSANSGNVGYVNEIGFGGSGATNVQSAIGNIVTNATASSNGALYFATRSVTTDTAPTERMRIDSSGNVGISTSSPTAKLHIAVDNATVDGTKGVRITNPAGTIVVLECGVSNDSFVGSTSSDFNIRAGNVEAVRIATSGNVGIGTSPSYRLSVANSSGVTCNLEKAGGASLQFTTSGATDAQLTGNGSGALVFYTGTSLAERMRIDSSGNLLVGTTSTNGSVSNTAEVLGGYFRSIAGSVSATTSAFTTLFTVPTGFSSYIVTVNIYADDVANYQSVVIVSTQGGSSTKVNVIVSSGLLAFQMSGYSLQAIQYSGGTQTIYYQAIRIAA